MGELIDLLRLTFNWALPDGGSARQVTGASSRELVGCGPRGKRQWTDQEMEAKAGIGRGPELSQTRQLTGDNDGH
jgi:hypothetical protein